jgi:hypothetical protein
MQEFAFVVNLNGKRGAKLNIKSMSTFWELSELQKHFCHFSKQLIQVNIGALIRIFNHPFFKKKQQAKKTKNKTENPSSPYPRALY